MFRAHLQSNFASSFIQTESLFCCARYVILTRNRSFQEPKFKGVSGSGAVSDTMINQLLAQVSKNGIRFRIAFYPRNALLSDSGVSVCEY